MARIDSTCQHVICQEVGHTFGLDAQSTDGNSLYTCMDYFSNTGENATNTQSTKPNAQDFEQLGNIYQYIDSFTTVAENTALDALSSNNVTDKSNTWGQLAEQSNDGRSSVYKKENVDGSITMTHVFWTIDAAQNDCTGCDHRNRYK